MSCFLLLLPCMLLSLAQDRIYLLTFIINRTADSTIPVDVRSKVCVCGRSLARTVVSNPAVCLLMNVVLFQVDISATG